MPDQKEEDLRSRQLRFLFSLKLLLLLNCLVKRTAALVEPSRLLLAPALRSRPPWCQIMYSMTSTQ